MCVCRREQTYYFKFTSFINNCFLLQAHMTPRDYQSAAFEAAKKSLLTPWNDIIVMPTGGGKSWIIAMIAQVVPSVLILQPSQELLKQNMEKLASLIGENEIGIYSASFGRKEIKRYTFATIQSVYKTPELFTGFKLVIVDECHQVAVRAAASMYTSFFIAIGKPKVIGLTATPYRLESAYHKDSYGSLIQSMMIKMLPRMRHKDAKKCFWDRIIFNVSHKMLLDLGYLSPIEYKDEPLLPYEEIPVNNARSDYNLEGYTQAIIGREAQILSTITEAQKRFKSVLIFCATTEQASSLSNVIVGSKCVFGETDNKERKAIVQGFKDGTVKTIFNVGCLTTGFDHPGLDCIILLRPTRSIVLYNQMIGRIVRTCPGKTHGTVIDLTGTVKALGRVESFKMYKNERGLWDLSTEKDNTWHDKVLFQRQIN